MSENESDEFQDEHSVEGSVATPASPSSYSEGEVDVRHHPRGTSVQDEQSGVLSTLRQYGQEEESGDEQLEAESSREQAGLPNGTAMLSSSADFGTDSEAEERAKNRFFQKLERGGTRQLADIDGDISASPSPTKDEQNSGEGQDERESGSAEPEKVVSKADNGQGKNVGGGPGKALEAQSTQELKPAAKVNMENVTAPSSMQAGLPSLPKDALRQSLPEMPPPSFAPQRPQNALRSSFPANGKPALEQLRPKPLQIVEDSSLAARASPVKSTPGSRPRPSSTDSRRQSATQRLGAVQSGNLGSKVEELRAQVAEERAARHTAQQKLADFKKEAERNEKKVREELEARVREAQRARMALEQRMSELEGGTAKERLARGGQEVILSGDELRSLQQEVKEQEALIQGYQAENEKLVERIREMQKQHKAEKEELERERERIAGHLAQVENETHTQQSTADVAAHLQRILQLEAELESVQGTAARREMELKFEIDRARQGRKEVESRYAGLDPHKMAQEDLALARANQELAAEREAHARDVALLEAKLKWYTENQEILTQQDETIKMQASRILDLEGQLRASSNSAGGPQSEAAKSRAAAVAPAKAAARIRQLEKQVKTLEASLAAQRSDPNSLAALIQATRGQEDEETVAMRAELEHLRIACASKDDEASKALRSLRQEHERIKRQYEERIKSLREQLQDRAAKKADRERGASAGRVKELEKQVEELRSFYTKKVKDLQRKLEEAGKAGPKEMDPNSSTPVKTPGSNRAAALARDLARAKERATQLEDVLARKEAALATLQQQVEQTKKEGAQTQSDVNTSSFQRELEQLRLQNQQLQAQLQGRGVHTTAPEATEQSVNTQERTATFRRGGWETRAKGEGWIEEVVALQRRAELAEMSRDLAQQQCTEAMEKAAVLRLQHQQTVARLQEAHAARLATLEHSGKEGPNEQTVASLQERLQEAEDARVELQKEVDRLTHQLQTGHAGAASAQLAVMERRLSEMEAKQRSREARWKQVVADTQRILQEEAEAEREQWTTAIKAKNAEILRFRAELDEILSMATEAQMHRLAMAH